MRSAELSEVQEQFTSADQQRHAATTGLWLFLATEVLFFGGLFLGYTAYRYLYPAAFRAASERTLVWAGALNTAILLISSLTMVLAVRAAELGKRKALLRLLCATAMLGLVFLAVKGFEYDTEIREGLLPGDWFHFSGPEWAHARIFFSFYFVMTGVHAVHVTIGIFLIGLYAYRVWREPVWERLTTGIDLLGLYWHFVDLVWVFLFPLLYLIHRHR